MACNLPIVSTDVGDVRKVVSGTEWCFVCDPQVSAFSARLLEILRRRPRTQGRQRIAHLDRAHVTRSLVHVYDEVLRRREDLD